MEITKEQILSHIRQDLVSQVSQRSDTLVSRIPVHLLSCDPEQRTLRFVAEILPQMENFWGIAHGGILATIFDICMGCTVRGFYQIPEVRTVSLHTTYLRAVPSDTVLQIQTRLLTTGKTLGTVDLIAWLPEQENTPTNQASGTFYLRLYPDGNGKN